LVNIWLYRDGHEKELTQPNLVSVMYYEMLANGALPMFHPENQRMAGTPEADRALFEFVSRVASEYAGRAPVEEVGIYYSSSSILARMLPGGMMTFDRQPHQFAFWGWATALGELHHQYRAVPEWKLNGSALKDLRLLVIPEAKVFEPEVVHNTLLPWVRDQGGLLVVTGTSGLRRGEAGNFALSPTGCSLFPLTGVKDPADAPQRSLRSVGKGKVLYLRGNPGMEFYLADTQNTREAHLPGFDDAMRELFADRKPPLVLAGRNSGVGLTVYENSALGLLFVDVNNLAVTPKTDAIQETPPLAFSVRLPDRLRGKELAARVLSPDSPARADLHVSEDRAEVILSPVRRYAGVVIGAR
jgi:hypothetical protein